MPRSFWTTEDDSALRDLKTRGLSASQIALEINKNRNQVIGRLHRLAIRTWDAEKLQRRKELAAERRKQRRVSRRRIALPPPPTPPHPAQSSKASTAFGHPCDLMDLAFASCRWPIGGDKITFCNAAAVPHLPYCHHHCMVAFK